MHFGYDARIIEQITGRPTYNLGSHASLGPMFHLHQADKLANPGDRIVLAIEYENFTTDWKVTNLLKDYVRWFDPSFDIGVMGYFSTRLFGHAREILITSVGVERLAAILDPFRPRPATATPTMAAPPVIAAIPAVSVAPTPPPTNPYDNALIDRWGDQPNKSTQAIPTATRAALQASGPFAIAPLRNRLFTDLHDFVQRSKARGVEVIATWPVIMKHEAYQSEKHSAFFVETRRALEEAGVKVVGAPHDVMVPFEQTLDTRYHLNEAGAEITSRALGQQLSQP
ncbi:hypothetical protein [Bosea sp. 2RAB26]|uniref:hypothetical protein n=1 Tax=Bosea sp. 2RAB26 TaxID=3237476 RepID=UPI003F8EB07E